MSFLLEARTLPMEGADSQGGSPGLTHPKSLAWMSPDNQMVDDFVRLEGRVSLDFPHLITAMNPLQHLGHQRHYDAVPAWSPKAMPPIPPWIPTHSVTLRKSLPLPGLPSPSVPFSSKDGLWVWREKFFLALPSPLSPPPPRWFFFLIQTN